MSRRILRLSERIVTGQPLADRLREARARFEAGQAPLLTTERLEAMAASDSPLLQRIARAHYRMKGLPHEHHV